MESRSADIVQGAGCGASDINETVHRAGHMQSNSGEGIANLEANCTQSSGGLEIFQEPTHDGEDPQLMSWKVNEQAVLDVDKQAKQEVDLAMTVQDQMVQSETAAWQLQENRQDQTRQDWTKARQP